MALDGGPGSPFAAGGVTIALLHAATPDPLAELAAMEPGEVVLVGRIASPPEESSFGYMADLRVERLWYEGREVLRGGGVEVFAGDLSVGVGDRVRVDGQISRSPRSVRTASITPGTSPRRE